MVLCRQSGGVLRTVPERLLLIIHDLLDKVFLSMFLVFFQS